MPTIEIVWKETPRHGLEKQGEFRCDNKTYHVEYYPNKNVTISNRYLDKISLPCPIAHLMALSPNNAVKINSPQFGHLKDFVLYFTHQSTVRAEDISSTLHCDLAEGVALANLITAV